MSKSADKYFNFCQILRKNFVCSRTLRNLLVELVFYHFVYHILTNSTDLLTIKSNYRPVCDGLKGGNPPWNARMIVIEIENNISQNKTT